MKRKLQHDEFKVFAQRNVDITYFNTNCSTQFNLGNLKFLITE